jgi:hypothetical protein
MMMLIATVDSLDVEIDRQNHITVQSMLKGDR